MCYQFNPYENDYLIETTIFYCKLHYKEKGLQNYKFKF